MHVPGSMSANVFSVYLFICIFLFFFEGGSLHPLFMALPAPARWLPPQVSGNACGACRAPAVSALRGCRGIAISTGAGCALLFPAKHWGNTGRQVLPCHTHAGGMVRRRHVSRVNVLSYQYVFFKNNTSNYMFFPKQANETKKILEGYGVKKKRARYH